MTPARAAAWLLLTTTLVAPWASAAPKAKARSARVDASAAPEARKSELLRQALQRHLAEAGLTQSLAGYVVAPLVVQLRRYVEAKRVTLACVVELSLRDHHGTLLATVRGSVTAAGASSTDAVDAATHAAVARLPQALQALRGDAASPQLAQARRQWELPLR